MFSRSRFTNNPACDTRPPSSYHQGSPSYAAAVANVQPTSVSVTVSLASTPAPSAPVATAPILSANAQSLATKLSGDVFSPACSTSAASRLTLTDTPKPILTSFETKVSSSSVTQEQVSRLEKAFSELSSERHDPASEARIVQRLITEVKPTEGCVYNWDKVAHEASVGSFVGLFKAGLQSSTSLVGGKEPGFSNTVGLETLKRASAGVMEASKEYQLCVDTKINHAVEEALSLSGIVHHEVREKAKTILVEEIKKENIKSTNKPKSTP